MNNLDDSTNKPFLYQELIDRGLTVENIASLYGRSPKQVKQELSKHPKNLSITKPDKHQRYPSEIPLVNCKNIVFNCPSYLVDAIDSIPGTNRRSKLIEIVELYLDLDIKPLPTIKPLSSDRSIGFRCPILLINDLDALPGVRTSHLMAAIEYFITKHSNQINTNE